LLVYIQQNVDQRELSGTCHRLWVSEIIYRDMFLSCLLVLPCLRCFTRCYIDSHIPTQTKISRTRTKIKETTCFSVSADTHSWLWRFRKRDAIRIHVYSILLNEKLASRKTRIFTKRRTISTVSMVTGKVRLYHFTVFLLSLWELQSICHDFYVSKYVDI